MTVIFDPSSNLPYIVRTTETHAIYGASTNDLYLTNYKSVSGMLFPHQIQTIYNSTSQNLDAALEDFIVEEITINSDFPPNFFSGLPESESMFPKSPPRKVQGIPHWRLTEFTSNMLWAGITNATVEGLKVQQPVAGLPNVHWLILDDATLGVKQMILEFENEVIVCDAPPQWTDVVIKWIKMNLKKPITHLWPTHHHRDHSGGADKYVAIGAKLIIPEMAVQYWSSIPNATFVTFKYVQLPFANFLTELKLTFPKSDTHPYVHADSAMQAFFVWQHQATHASDWSYAFVTTTAAAKNCPPTNITATNAPIALFEADAWHAGMPDEINDQALMRQWLDQLKGDGVPENAM